MERRIVNPWTWQDQLGFVQAHEVTGHQRILYCAGQTSMSAEGSPLHEGDMHAQLHQTLDNLETVLAEAGYTLADVVRLNAYTTDVDQFFGAWESAAMRLGKAGAKISSTLLGVSRLAFPELLVELEATAVK